MTDDELDGLAHLVKPLEWSIGPHKSDAGDYSAQSLLGEYSVRRLHTGRWNLWQNDIRLSDARHGAIMSYGHPAYAKAAAQADYTRRILSALNLDALRSPPADVGEAARVLLDADDWMPVSAKLAAIKAHLAWKSKVQPVAVVRAWQAALRALAETTKGDDPSTET